MEKIMFVCWAGFNTKFEGEWLSLDEIARLFFRKDIFNVWVPNEGYADIGTLYQKSLAFNESWRWQFKNVEMPNTLEWMNDEDIPF
jgi:hypothetical protein